MSGPALLSEQAAMLANRLRKSRRRLARWAAREGVTCYRVYDHDIPEIPLLVDWYEGRVHVAERETRRRREAPEEAEATLDAWLSAVREVLEVSDDELFVKTRRRQKGAAQYGRVDTRGAAFVVGEGGHRFRVNLSDYLDTGLFLDHRPTRALVAAEARGRRFLNLFCYTASFTVYAAAAGAASSTSVDLSNTYLAWAEENLRLNALDPGRHRLVRDDVLAWLDHAARRGERYDLAVLDPPTWSTSARMEGTLDVQRDHVDLVRRARRLLAPGGVLWFSTHARRFELDPAAFAGAEATDMSRRTLPPDFRDPRTHRCWRAVEAA